MRTRIITASATALLLATLTACGNNDKPDTSNQQDAAPNQTEKFAACVKESGTPSEKTAAGHVVNITGADKMKDSLGRVKIWTDYKGGSIGPDGDNGTLLALAFASCNKSYSGLPAVYSQDGHVMAGSND